MQDILNLLTENVQIILSIAKTQANTLIFTNDNTTELIIQFLQKFSQPQQNDKQLFYFKVFSPNYFKQRLFPTFILSLWYKLILASKNIIPRDLFFGYLCGVLSLTSPSPSSDPTKAKNSSKFSPSTLAKQKLLNFKVPGPSSRI